MSGKEPTKLTHEQYLKVLQAFIWYAYNCDKIDMINEVYGFRTDERGPDEGHESYKQEKLATINSSGFLYWAGELDEAHRRRLVESMARKYPDLTAVSDG